MMKWVPLSTREDEAVRLERDREVAAVRKTEEGDAREGSEGGVGIADAVKGMEGEVMRRGE